MSDLISRDDVLSVLCFSNETGKMLCEDLRNILEEINKIPSAEPERKIGQWLDRSWSETDPNVCYSSFEMQSAKCSVCGKYHTTPYLYYFDNYPYCPNCGADMRSDR